MILFVPAWLVLVGMVVAAAILTVVTMYPYLKHRLVELREEDSVNANRQ